MAETPERVTRAVSMDGHWEVYYNPMGHEWIIVENGGGRNITSIPDAPGRDAATVLAAWEKERDEG